MGTGLPIRGIETPVDPNKFRRDIRRPEQKFWDSVSKTKFGYWFFGALFLWSFFVPGILFPVVVFSIFVLPALSNEISRRQLPLRLPIESNMTDFGDPKPGHSGFNKSRGWFYVGRDAKSGEELYLTGEDLLAHTLVFGTTGAGKTEFLTGWAINSLSIGSGLVYADAKGTSALHSQIYMAARMFARDDDYLVLNFATGGKQIKKDSPVRKSNTLNPLSSGTPEALYSLLSSFLPASNGDNAIFAQKAQSMMSSILYPLVWLRDRQAIRLSVRAIREHISLEKVMMLAGYPDKPVYGENIPEDVKKPVKFYLSSSVAGFNPEKSAHDQEPDSVKYHDFSQNYFSMPLSFMSDTYGFVYDCQEGEVDFEDVIYRRRILTVLLPSVEKSPTELKQLGGLILTGIKNVLSLGLGDKYEGDTHDMLLKLPVRTDKPTLCIVDEIGYIIVEGFAVTAAQARGLGTAFVYAGQDYAGLKRGSEIEAEQITANTRSKFVMSLEDVQQTWNIVKELAGEDFDPRLSGYQLPEDQSTKVFQAGKNVDLQRHSRVDILDLKGQIEGDFHLFFRERLVRGMAFHAALEPKKTKVKIQINRFLEVISPTSEMLDEKYGFIFDAKKKFKQIEKIPDGEISNTLTLLSGIDVDDDKSTGHLACILMGKPTEIINTEEVPSIPEQTMIGQDRERPRPFHHGKTETTITEWHRQKIIEQQNLDPSAESNMPEREPEAPQEDQMETPAYWKPKQAHRAALTPQEAQNQVMEREPVTMTPSTTSPEANAIKTSLEMNAPVANKRAQESFARLKQIKKTPNDNQEQ